MTNPQQSQAPLLPLKGRAALKCCLILLLLILPIWPGLGAGAFAAEPVEILVEGVEGDARKNVLEALTLPYGLVKDSKVEPLWLERFAAQADRRVLSALEPFGYYGARVTIAVEIPKANFYVLRVQIEHGPQTILTDVSVSVTGPGASEASLIEMSNAFPLKLGDVLKHRFYEQAKYDLKAGAENIGYLDARYRVHEIRVNPATSSAAIELVLETGEKYFFSEIVIEGAPDYPDEFVRQYLTFVPGDVFSYGKLAQSQIRLHNSERFRDVTLLAERDKALNYAIPVRVTLSQIPRRSLRPGVGYGTDTGARVSLRYRDLNMFQRGHELDSQLFVSERLQGLATRYIIPSNQDVRTFTSAQINLQHEDVTTYRSRIISLELARNHALGEQRQGAVYVRFQEEAFTVSDQDATSRYVLPGVRFSDSYYNNPVRPSRGVRYALDLRGTHRALGSTTECLQLITEASAVMPLPWRFSFITAGKSALTFFSDPVSDIPPSLRFFAGGDQSVRGYAYQSLGPKDDKGNVVGGKHLLSASVQLQRAIREDWAVSVFYNAGNAFDTFRALTLYQAAGAGIHYFTPVGALNLYLARQIDVDEPGYRLHLTVGFEF